ncbi:MAG TPA: DUF2203 domain-containing protein [Chloroflexota bacterium]|nr:DUF2203 domain-containing protein [Chloroflexota bacterium]
MKPHAFSLDEANALIPDLERRFEELQALQQRAEELEASIENLVERDRSNGRNHGEEIAQLEGEIERVVTRTNQIIDEISDLGCEIKDIEQGLVDFPSEREGRLVYLCWKLGEDRIRFWHELTSGYAGRQPL